MDEEKGDVSKHRRWAEFRLAIIGSLLAAPPERGFLKAEIANLAKKEWRHPFTCNPIAFSVGSIERWYYLARSSDNPVDDLIKKSRGDRGKRCIDEGLLASLVFDQYKQHPSWSRRLHFDNLLTIVEEKREYGPMPSYATLCRWMRDKGLLRQRKRRKDKGSRASEYRALFDSSETRGFEAPWPGTLWHLDFHHARRRVLTPDGRWITPILLAIMDDCSRLACHIQWYEHETTETLVHGFRQALQKRNKPHGLISDNGSAMTSAEFTEGLRRLSIEHHLSLPYCPEQNGKKERFFSTVEGRLMSMLESREGLTLKELNDATIAWVEMEYNRIRHDEIMMSPLEKFFSGKNLHRNCPDLEELSLAFTRQRKRTPRRFDSTLTIDGVRFEIPWAYRHLKKLIVRYAEWNLSTAWLMDQDGERTICKIFPQDKIQNFSDKRRLVDPVEPYHEDGIDDIAPLLKKLMAEYAATGLPPAYIENHHMEE